MAVFPKLINSKLLIAAGTVLLCALAYTYQHLTEPRLILPMLFLPQQHPYTCEAAALRMVLNFHGLSVTEDEILQKMPKDPTPRTESVWGDPERGFVGDIYGNSSRESYGIHWRPMKSLAEQWKKAELIENGTLQVLTKHLKKSRPLILWVAREDSAKMYWRTPAGKSIEAVDGEHTIVVRGFRGSEENPSGFYILDPVREPGFIASGRLLKLWRHFDRAGLVLYP